MAHGLALLQRPRLLALQAAVETLLHVLTFELEHLDTPQEFGQVSYPCLRNPDSRALGQFITPCAGGIKRTHL